MLRNYLLATTALLLTSSVTFTVLNTTDILALPYETDRIYEDNGGGGGGDTPPPINPNPDSPIRSVSVSGTVNIVDDESWPWSDERESIPVSASVIAGIQPTALARLNGCAGDEVRVEVEIDAQISTSNYVVIPITARLFEGTSCTTQDLEDTQYYTVTVPPSPATYLIGVPVTINLSNSGFGGGDTATINLNITNKGG